MQTAVGSTTREACAWCGITLAGSSAEGGVAHCRRCGAGTTYPRPTDEELDAAYAGWYRPAGGRFSGVGDALLRWTRSRLAVRIDHVAPGGPVLDVGAGEGSLLDALAARGRRASGLEREATRPDVRAAQLAEIGGEWAAVVLWHSLEHLRYPGADLVHAAGLVAPGGVLIVAMPNAESVQARVFGERWLARDLPRHLVHVPASALLQRIGELGLRVERVSHLRGGQVAFGWLHGLVGGLTGGLSLYDAIRRSEARERPMNNLARAGTLALAAVLAPIALALAGLEAVFRRGGTVYVEARQVGPAGGP